MNKHPSCLSFVETLRKGASGPQIESARANLAGSFVNAFVNAGFGNDKLMVDAPEGESWIYKNKDHGELHRFIIGPAYHSL